MLGMLEDIKVRRMAMMLLLPHPIGGWIVWYTAWVGQGRSLCKGGSVGGRGGSLSGEAALLVAAIVGGAFE